MADLTNDMHLDVYLEPAIEINREVVDPLGSLTDPVEPVVYNICSSGGC
jgi:hypothetical protein